MWLINGTVHSGPWAVSPVKGKRPTSPAISHTNNYKVLTNTNKPLPCLKVQPTNCHIGWNTQYCPMFSQNRKQIWFISKTMKRTYPSCLKSVMIDNEDKMFTENCMRTKFVEPQLWCICRWDISVQQYEALCARCTGNTRLVSYQLRLISQLSIVKLPNWYNGYCVSGSK